MLKGIVFDLDGTLVDSLSLTFDAFNRGIVQQGGQIHTPQQLMAHFGPGEDKIFLKILGSKSKAEKAYLACREYLDENLHRCPLHEGVLDLLDHFKNAGVPMSIFTGRSWNTTEVILKHHGLLDRFVTVVANDHVDHPKPSPEGLYLALKRMALQPGEALFVGDSPVDILAARSAGALGVAALWDLLADRGLLERHQPHHWAEKPKELIRIWEKSN